MTDATAKSATAIEWRFVAAEDCSVDSEYRLFVNGADVGISVQDATSYGGGYAVGREEGAGDDFGIRHFGAYRTLKMAKAVAQRVFRTGG
jgi:hypothetical protein